VFIRSDYCICNGLAMVGAQGLVGLNHRIFRKLLVSERYRDRNRQSGQGGVKIDDRLSPPCMLFSRSFLEEVKEVPELPEVQTIVDGLNAAGVPGCRIDAVTVRWPKTIATCSPEVFSRRLKGRGILKIYRRAKYIVFELSDRLWMLVHLRMTGRLVMPARTGKRKDPHLQVLLRLDDSRCIAYHDTRKFGRFFLTAAPESILGELGPEPLAPGFSAKVLYERIGRRRRRIKPLLLDQGFLSGLGNIYVDEALWLARIHPLRAADTLSWRDIRSLHRAIRCVLRQGIRNAGTSLGKGKGNFVSAQSDQGRNRNHLKVFQRTGQACRRCGHAIERIVVGQRGTHVCSRCQV
jgi:formamidopyrimidine-DNA glycosylase